jgi:hypothetical protein
MMQVSSQDVLFLQMPVVPAGFLNSRAVSACADTARNPTHHDYAAFRATKHGGQTYEQE